jgi:hypothetical protein
VAELRPVAGPSSPVQRHIRRLLIVAVVGLVVVIVKPWGDGMGASTASVPLTTPEPAATPTVSPTPVGRMYDFLAFGINEPPPGWELWPAGRLASFTYAMRIDMAVRLPAVPTSSGSAAAASGAGPSPTPEPSPTPPGSPSSAGVPATWPTIRVPRGSVLDLVGINEPRGYVIHVTGLTRIEDDGSETPVRALLGTSPWPDHFTTIGYAPKTTEDAMAPWPSGHYRLELTIDPGAVARTVEIVVEGSASEATSGAAGSGTPAESPGGSATP